MKGRLGLFVFAAILLSNPNGFLNPPSALAASDHLLITEVQISGGPGQTTFDFIELHNPTTSPIDLDGYRLIKRTATGSTDSTIKSWTSSAIIPAGGFYLWANSNYTSIPTTPDTTTSESIADNNGIALRFGPANTGTIIDSLAWGTASNGLAEGFAYPTNPPALNSLERKQSDAEFQDSDDNSSDFTIQTSPSPQSSGGYTAPVTPTPSSDSSGMPLDTNQAPRPGEIVINELVSDPGDGGTEWVELYNRTSRYIDLSGLTLEEGGGTTTQLTGGIGADSQSHFALITTIKGNLNNDGDIVILKHQGIEIDRVAYGNWDDGSKGDNASAAKDPYAIGRILDGGDSNNDVQDFDITDPTPGQPNKRAVKTTAETGESDTPPGIVINELCPNPPGSDADGEFIELTNLGQSTIQLTGWKISDGTTTYLFPSRELPSLGFALLRRNETNIVLDNSGTEILTLTSVAGQTSKTSYQGPVTENSCWDRRDDGSYGWTNSPTPGGKNSIPRANLAPRAYLDAPDQGAVNESIFLDGSDSIDPDGNALLHTWDLGDNTTSNAVSLQHTYNTAGVYTITLTIRDDFGDEVKAEHNITITNGQVLGTSSETFNLELSEFIPNPVGSDTAEWVEIFNPGNASTTSGWAIRVNGKLYELPGIDVPGQGYVIIERSSAKFTLVNGGGSLALVAPNGTEQNIVTYGQSKEGESYAWDGRNWRWTSDITPGEENSFSNATDNTVRSEYEPVALSDIRALDHGSKVTVDGLVASPRGELGTNIMFMAGSGLQVSGSGTGWPKLQPGDYIRLSGSVSKSSSGTKLIVRSGKYVQLLGRDKPAQPEQLPLSDIDEDKEGTLVVVTGRITAKTATSFTVSDGEEITKVYLKNRSLNWPIVPTGQQATVTGFVALSNNTPVIWARTPEDLAFAPAQEPEVLGETIDLSQSKQHKNWQGYLLLGLIAGILGVSYLWERQKLPSLKQLWNRVRRREM